MNPQIILHVTSSHLKSSYKSHQVTPSRLTSSHLTSPRLTSLTGESTNHFARHIDQLISTLLTSFQLITNHLARHVMSPRAISPHLILTYRKYLARHVTSCHITSHHLNSTLISSHLVQSHLSSFNFNLLQLYFCSSMELKILKLTRSGKELFHLLQYNGGNITGHHKRVDHVPTATKI